MERIFFEEELSDSYEPTEQEVQDYATHELGLRMPAHQHLLYLARQALTEKLHQSWRPFRYPYDQTVYYLNSVTGKVVDVHPVEFKYRQIAAQLAKPQKEKPDKPGKQDKQDKPGKQDKQKVNESKAKFIEQLKITKERNKQKACAETAEKNHGQFEVQKQREQIGAVIKREPTQLQTGQKILQLQREREKKQQVWLQEQKELIVRTLKQQFQARLRSEVAAEKQRLTLRFIRQKQRIEAQLVEKTDSLLQKHLMPSIRMEAQLKQLQQQYRGLIAQRLKAKRKLKTIAKQSTLIAR